MLGRLHHPPGDNHAIVVRPLPLHLPPFNIPVAREVVVRVRLRPDQAPYPRCAIEACGITYLLHYHLDAPKDRTKVWVAQVLRHDEDDDCCWVPSHTVVVKESDMALARHPLYGRQCGEDGVGEIAGLIQLSQPGNDHVIKPLAYFRGPAPSSSLFLVLPHLPNGDFFDVVKRYESRGMPENEAKVYVRQMVEALLYMKRSPHGGIRHGDLSPENFAIDAQGRLVLIDLGMAVRVPPPPSPPLPPPPLPHHHQQQQHLRVAAKAGPPPVLLASAPRRGKLQYISAEVYHEREYDPWAADMWSLGAIVYVTLTGVPLYRSPEDSTFRGIMRGTLLVKDMLARARKGCVEESRHLSKEAVDLLTAMLRPRMGDRITLEEMAVHPWLATATATNTVTTNTNTSTTSFHPSITEEDEGGADDDDDDDDDDGNDDNDRRGVGIESDGGSDHPESRSHHDGGNCAIEINGGPTVSEGQGGGRENEAEPYGSN